MSKKILIGLIVTLILIAIALGVYFFFFSPKGEGGDGDFSFGKFFPFGNPQGVTGDSTENRGGNEEGVSTTTEEVVPAPRIRKISNDQIAGSTLIDTRDATIVRYVERGTGHVYEATSNTLSQKKISNTTIPKIYEALWTGKGDSVLLRYLKSDNETIETFYAKLGKSNSATEDSEVVGELEGTFLQTDIKEIVVSPSKVSIFSLISDISGSIGTVSLPDGTKISKIFSLPVKEFLVSWPKDSTLVLTTKPSANVLGYTYTLDSKSGAFVKVLGDIRGLTVLANPALSHILYSEGRQGKIFLNIFDVKNGSFAATPFQTLPEKCVWSKAETLVFYCAVPKEIVSGEYPDIWYQGSLSFSDKIWKIDLNTNTTTLIADTKEEAAIDVDAIHLSLNEKENYLTFTNKKDSSLWGIQLDITP